ncbi:MAG: ubiquinone/menaquinone biosynthesis methyltransferase [Deltaproteobacteria bacterium]|nr:ubiquinone/menaquinone biosynthesis methyltransferase [Deltaproteobacteria bacterium]
MFDSIAARYDLLNRLISLGLDRLWRRRLVRALAIGNDARVLDVATGTADVALAIAALHATAHVTGLDPSPRMLDVGRQKVAALGLDKRVALVAGDAQAMPFSAGAFDATCISFGIRNVPDRAKGLAEMRRVTRAGGRVVVLELAEPKGGPMAALARVHVHHLVPLFGRWLTGSDAYGYLRRSIAQFPDAEVFAEMMRAAGLAPVDVYRQSFGAATLFVGVVP